MEAPATGYQHRPWAVTEEQKAAAEQVTKDKQAINTFINDNSDSKLIRVYNKVDHKPLKIAVVTGLSLVALAGIAMIAIAVVDQYWLNVPFFGVQQDLGYVAELLADTNIMIGFAAGTAVVAGTAIGLGIYFFNGQHQAQNESELDENQKQRIRLEIAADELMA